MLIDFEQLVQEEVSQETEEWMKKNGTNHQFLQDAWKEDPDSDFATSPHRIAECMAYAIKNPHLNKAVMKRLWGKFNAARKRIEERSMRNAKDSFEIEALR